MYFCWLQGSLLFFVFLALPIPVKILLNNWYSEIISECKNLLFSKVTKANLPETEDCCKAVVDLENLFSITDLNLGVLVSRELTEVTEPFRKERVGNRFSFEVILVLLLLRLIFITVGFRFLYCRK